VLLGQPYMWKCHVFYESRHRSVIVNLGGHLYRIPEVVLTTVPPKKCHKVVSHTAKFIFFTIFSKGEQKDTAFFNSLSPNRFMIDFHKLSSATSPARQAAHRDADSENAFPSPPGTGGLIRVDIGGHPPFPTGPKQFSGNFGNLLFLAVFNFQGQCEGPNEGFSRSRFSMISYSMIETQK
jgi:hypothetical protein